MLERRVTEIDPPSRKPNIPQVDMPACERRPVEEEVTTSEVRAVESPAVECGIGEVKVKVAPAMRCLGNEPSLQDPEHRVANLAFRSVLRNGVIRHAQVGTEHVHAGLPLLLPVIGKLPQVVDT